MAVIIPENTIYWCQLCNRWFRRGLLRCLVNHPAGQCCHYGDMEIVVKPLGKAG